MTLRVGDTAFIRGGTPVTVKDRDPHSAQLVLESDPDVVRQQTRHGYLNGLSPEVRQQFYEILDTVKGDSEDPETRINQLNTKVAELEQDPRNLQLSRYLRAEMNHIMNTFNIRPREYSHPRKQSSLNAQAKERRHGATSVIWSQVRDLHGARRGHGEEGGRHGHDRHRADEGQQVSPLHEHHRPIEQEKADFNKHSRPDLHQRKRRRPDQRHPDRRSTG